MHNAQLVDDFNQGNDVSLSFIKRDQRDFFAFLIRKINM
jgi:hypothetical protein